MPAVEPILLTIAEITTFAQQQQLTRATGFFFRRDERLYLVTSRHVLVDEPSGHFPDRIEIGLFIDAKNLVRATGFSIPLYREGKSLWIGASDKAGIIDVVAIELNLEALPEGMVYEYFSPETLCPPDAHVEVGTPLMVVGFPLGFSDSLHHLPVVRQAGLASSYGLRFQGMGYFLTDARTHRGISGAPVLMRVEQGTGTQPEFHWRLLGVHSARLDVGRDLQLDEALGLNCAWYADILLTLTRG